MDVKRSIQNLFSRSKAFDPASQQFMSVDRDALEKDLELKEKSEEQGTANIPKTDATGKDAIATNIDAYVTEVLRRGKDELQDHLRAIGALDSVQTIDHHFTELRTNTLEVINNFYMTCKNGVNELYPKRRVVADGELAYEKFRSENNLTRPAYYPENRFRSIWWIIFALVLEAVFNGVSLGFGHPSGILRAIYETVFIAVVNVALGVLVGGYFWRQTYHTNKLRVLFNYILSVAFVAVILVFHFLIGHYRDALQAAGTKLAGANQATVTEFYSMDLVPIVVEKAFSANYYGFTELISVLLIIMGITMFFVAAIKAFDMDDPYPGYGILSRAQDKRNAEYADLFSELQEELEKIGADANVALTGIYRMGEVAQRTLTDHQQLLQALESKYSSWVSELHAVGTALYAKYRELNEQHRTEPSPNAFQINFSFSDDMAKPPVSPKVAKEHDVGHLQTLMNACLATVNEANNKYLVIYKTIGELAPENVKKERSSTYDVEVEKVNTELQKLLVMRQISLKEG